MPARGRPRNPAIDGAILAATREVLVEVGYAGLSMEAVAARARVSKPTLYLRYPSRAALVFAAIFGQTRARPIPDTGSLAGDLHEAYNWAVDEFTGPEARVALPGLLAELSANPELAQFVGTAVIAPESARVRQRLEQAQQRGELRTDVDLDLAVDVFIGTALARVSLLDHPVDYDYSRALVELVLDGLRVR